MLLLVASRCKPILQHNFDVIMIPKVIFTFLTKFLETKPFLRLVVILQTWTSWKWILILERATKTSPCRLNNDNNNNISWTSRQPFFRKKLNTHRQTTAQQRYPMASKKFPKDQTTLSTFPKISTEFLQRRFKVRPSPQSTIVWCEARA